MRKGDQFKAMGCLITVDSVSRRGEWANVRVRQLATGARWRKRQLLPVPNDWERVET